MNAVISGCTGVAILVEGPHLFSIDMLHPERVPRQAAEVRHLLGEGRDLIFLKDVALDEVQRRLVEASDAEDALRMVLRRLDGETAADIRADAAEDLEGLLASPEVEERVECVLFAHPFPSGTDPIGAVAAAKRASATKASAFLRHLVSVQPAIEEVCSAWREIPIELLTSGAERMRAQRVMVREGVFRGLVMARAEGSRADSVVALSLQKTGIKTLPGYRAILQAWAAKLPVMSAPARTQDWRMEPREAEPPSEKRGSYSGRILIKGAEVFEKVKSQKAQIVRALDRYDTARALGLVEDLVTYQLSHGKAEFAVKSLCDLAKEAQRRGILEIQLELTARAVALGPHDGWAWAQRGKALLDARKFSEALKACELAVSYSDYVEAKNGRAEVLKALGRFDDALKAYDLIRSEHPDNVVAKTGRAEVLKSLGRFDDALKDYDLIRSEHPDNVVAKNGRAEVLKSLGRFDDALKAYDLIRSEHPTDVVAKTGRAEVLKSLGRFDDALRAYDQIRSEHPDNVVAKNGRAELLKSLGRFNDALIAYEQTAREHPSDVVAKNGRAEVLKSLGRFDDALKAYDLIRSEHPSNVVTRNGMACVLAVLGRPLEALELLSDEPPRSDQDWIGFHIRGMILLRTGKVDEAIAIFERGVAKSGAINRDYYRTALALARLHLRDYAAAATVLDQIRSPLLRTQTTVLRVHSFGAQGQFSRAAEAYEQLPTKTPPIIADLIEELRRRFVERRPALHDDAWLVQRELDYDLASL